MRSRLVVAVAGALALVATLLAGPGAASAEVRVVATVPDLAAIARQVGGAAVTVESLSLPTQDPHFVDAKPSLALLLNRADLLLYVGLELESGWLPTLLVGARNGRIGPGGPGNLDCSSFVRKLDIPQGAVDRSQGDIHPGGNPHYLYDPRAGAAVARGIAARLAQIDPARAAEYNRNRDGFLKELDAARQRWEARLAARRGAPVVTYHRTFTYLADWLGLEPVGFLEPKPGIPPNPRHIAGLLGLAKQRKVQVILQEEHYPDSTSRLVASRIPARLVRVPAATNLRSRQTYVQHLEEIVGRLAAGLEGRP